MLLFGLSENKSDDCQDALKDDGIVQKSIKLIKENFKDLFVITDICVCAYTTHGHCGIVKNNYVDNDASLDILTKMALSHAKSGADMVAPSAMMDMQVGAIRQTLDKAGYHNTGIMAYSAIKRINEHKSNNETGKAQIMLEDWIF